MFKLTTLLCSLLLTAALSAQVITLLPPQRVNGKSIMECLHLRKSTKSFEFGKVLSAQQLSNILFAAGGKLTDFEVCQLSRDFLMNQTYDRTEGKICFEYILQGIRDKRQIPNIEELIMKLDTSNAPEHLIRLFLSTFDRSKLTSYALQIVSQMIKKGTAVDPEAYLPEGE